MGSVDMLAVISTFCWSTEWICPPPQSQWSLMSCFCSKHKFEILAYKQFAHRCCSETGISYKDYFWSSVTRVDTVCAHHIFNTENTFRKRGIRLSCLTSMTKRKSIYIQCPCVFHLDCAVHILAGYYLLYLQWSCSWEILFLSYWALLCAKPKSCCKWENSLRDSLRLETALNPALQWTTLFQPWQCRYLAILVIVMLCCR